MTEQSVQQDSDALTEPSVDPYAGQRKAIERAIAAGQTDLAKSLLRLAASSPGMGPVKP